jgi:hypothetical protein
MPAPSCHWCLGCGLIWAQSWPGAERPVVHPCICTTKKEGTPDE